VIRAVVLRIGLDGCDDMMFSRNEYRELTIDELDAVSGGGDRIGVSAPTAPITSKPPGPDPEPTNHGGSASSNPGDRHVHLHWPGRNQAVSGLSPI